MNRIDLLRHSYEVAYHAGKRFKNKETGFIENPRYSGIPFYENALFTLALFRSKTQEGIIEAKQLLDKLIYFQQRNQELPSYGNFPIFLHEYPECKDHFLAPKIILIFHCILKDFSLVLGQVLKEKIQKSLEAALQFCECLQQREVHLPFYLKLIISCVAGRKEEVPSIDSFQLQDYTLEALGMQLATLYSMQESIQSSELFSYISSTYHYVSKTYCGPAFRNLYCGGDLQGSLYDHMMGQLTGQLSERAERASSRVRPG